MAKNQPLRKKSGDDAAQKSVLVLHNDDVNTFEHVIKSLVEVCGHDKIQAEQCAVITHFKGKYDIKTGSYAVLFSMAKKLKNLNLRTEIKKSTAEEISGKK